MPYTIPNSVDATYAQQARLDSRDLDMMTAAPAVTGVISGCAVTAQGSPNMTVAVAAGVVRIAGRKVVVTAANSGTIGAADATNPRIDLITITTAGAITIVAGTAAATPVIPVIPASRVVLARVDIPATFTTIGTGQIIDKRVVIADTKVENVQWYGALGDTRTVTDGAMTSGSATLTSATAAFTAADVGKQVQVARASSANFALMTTIASFTNSTTIVLAAPAAFSLTSLSVALDGRTVTDGVTTANSTTLTSASAAFTAADVGHHITVGLIAQGAAGAQSAAVNTTITAYTNATTVTIGANATRTCTASQVVIGTDDTAAFQLAMTTCRDTGSQVVYVPEATYLIAQSVSGVGAVRLYSNIRFRGDGWGSVLRSIGGGATSGGAENFAINPWADGDNLVANNIRNIVIEDLHFQGTTVEDGFRQGLQLLSMAAASDVTVQRCKFSNCRSDAIYINMGSSVATLERHNERVKILNCTFDGINRDNRNALSILDCDDLLVDGCTFINFSRQDMPGAIDVEPNTSNIYPVIRGHRFTNNYIWFCGGNSGHIGMFLNMPQTRQVTPQRGMNISDNFIAGGVGGQMGFFINQQQYPTEATYRNDIKIERNVVEDCYYVAELEGMKGLQFRNNIVRNCTFSLILGYSFKNLDVDISDNMFSTVGSIGTYAIEVVQADRTIIDRNVFENVGDAGLSQGFIVRFNNGGALNVPAAPTLATATTGGTLASGTKSYKVTARRDNATETTASTAATIATTGTTSTVTVTWVEDPGAADYRVYGRTGGSELLMATVAAGTLSWIDTGSVTPSGALPGANTTANGNSNGVQFTNNIVRQGASNRTTQVANKTANHITAGNRYQNNIVPDSSWAISTGFRDPSATLAGDFTTSSTTAVDTPLSFPIAASEQWAVDCWLMCSKATSATGMKLAVNAPAGCTITGTQEGGQATMAAALVPSEITTIATLGTTFATGTATKVMARLSFRVKNSTTAGTITIQAATVTSNVATIYAGSYMNARRVTAET